MVLQTVTLLKNWPKMAIIGLTAACLAGCMEGPSAQQVTASAPAQTLGEGFVVAITPDEASRKAVEEAATQRGYTLRTRTTLGGLGLQMVSFDIPDTVTPKQAIDALEADVPTSTVGINHAYFPQQAGARGRNYANSAINWPNSNKNSNGNNSSSRGVSSQINTHPSSSSQQPQQQLLAHRHPQ